MSLALLLGACTSSGGGSANATKPTLDLAHAGAAPFKAGGSVGQVYVTGAHAGDDLQLVRDGSVVAPRPWTRTGA